MYYYINTFFFYSILGHVVETFFYMLGSGESGILYGFWTPIYGIGSCFIIWCFLFLKNKVHPQKSKQILLIFLCGFFLLSFLEFIGGHLIEYLFGKVFWDYSNFPFHIGHYISVEMAFIWGIASVLLIFLLKPISDKIVKKIPRWISWIFLFLFVVDLFFTIIGKR